MENKSSKIHGMGSLSPNYYKKPDIQDKVFKIKESYEIDKVLEYDIDSKILIYEDRVNGWFLNFAEELTKKDNSEFVVLMICINYLEGNQQFREGKSSLNNSSETLKRALKRIFPETEEETLDYLIDRVRHGLFHDGMTRRGALLRYGLSIPFFTFTMRDGEKWLEIDPSKFLEEVRKDFAFYIEILKNKENKKERSSFENHYNERYESPKATHLTEREEVIKSPED